jgi:hypothetical protein
VVSILPATFRGEKHIQEYVENDGRKQIGLYLNEVMSANQTVGCEPLGYISYYSRRSVYDYPGLCSRKVVDFLRSNPDKRRLDHMLEYFRPDFIVLRHFEYNNFRADGQNRWLLEEYQVQRAFVVPHERRHEMLFPEANIDLDFLVFARKRPASR